MKRALVLTLLVLGLGVFAFAGPLSGEWDTDICFDVATDGTVEVKTLTSLVTIDYEVCGWTFGTHATFDFEDGLKDVGFTIDGALGAFQFASDLDFNPTAADLDADGFSYWKGYVTIAIAGVDLYAGWMLEDVVGATIEPFVYSGFMLGGYGTVGDCTLYVEADFGMAPQLYYVYYKSLSYAYTWTFDTTDTSCDVEFSNLDVYAEFPFACLDVLFETGFNCLVGWKGASFTIADIDLGLGWLQVEDLQISFTNDSKMVDLDFELVTADTVCITPYLSVIVGGGQWQFDGISLDALALEYTWNGVTFLATEIFDKYHFKYNCATTLTTGAYENGENELIGIEIDGDSCCGGSFDAYIYNFFTFVTEPATPTDVDHGSLFAWGHTCVGLNYGISSSVTLNASILVTDAGLSKMCFGFEFIW